MSDRLVILNDSERPEARMIVVVTEKDGVAWWQYVSTAKRLSQYTRWSPVQFAEHHTPLDKFGVSARLETAPNFDRLHVERVAPSRATYPDGLARDWQGELPEFTSIRPEVADIVRSAIRFQKEIGQ
jgi:hypothetical protein